MNTREYIHDIDLHKREIHETIQRLIQYNWNGTELIEEVYTHLTGVKDHLETILITLQDLCQQLFASSEAFEHDESVRRQFIKRQRNCAQTIDTQMRRLTLIAASIHSSQLNIFVKEVFGRVFKQLFALLGNLKVDFLKTHFVLQLFQHAKSRSLLITLSAELQDEFTALQKILDVYMQAKDNSQKYRKIDEVKVKVQSKTSSQRPSIQYDQIQPDKINKLKQISTGKNHMEGKYLFDDPLIDFEDKPPQPPSPRLLRKQAHRQLLSRIQLLNERKEERIVKYLSQDRPQHQFVSFDITEQMNNCSIFCNKQKVILLPKLINQRDQRDNNFASFNYNSQSKSKMTFSSIDHELSRINRSIEPYRQSKVLERKGKHRRVNASLSENFLKSLKHVNNLTGLHPNSRLAIDLNF